MSTKPLRPTSSSHPVSVTDTHSFDSSTSIIHHVLGHVSLGKVELDRELLPTSWFSRLPMLSTDFTVSSRLSRPVISVANKKGEIKGHLHT